MSKNIGENLKIYSIIVKGLQGVEFAEMNLECLSAFLVGKNGQGKTSAAETALKFLFTNYKPDGIIKIGMDKCEVAAVLKSKNKHYEIRRTYKNGASNSSLTVYEIDSNGVKLKITKSINTFVKELINEKTFDRQLFSGQSTTEALKTALNMLKVDFTDIDSELKKSKTNRTAYSQNITANGEEKEVFTPEEIKTFEDKKVDVTKEFEKKQILADRFRLKNELLEIEKESEKLEKEQSELEKKHTEKTNLLNLSEMNMKIDETKEKIDLNIKNSQIINDDITKKLSENEKNIESNEKLEKLIKGKKDLTTKIEELRGQKSIKLSDASKEVTGLKIDIDNIYYAPNFVEKLIVDGVDNNEYIPFQSLSTSQVMELSVLISRYDRPELSVLLIDRIESMDPEKQNRVIEFCKQFDFQCLMMKVDEVDQNFRDKNFELMSGDTKIFEVKEGKVREVYKDGK